MIVTGAQIRAARALVGWHQSDLASAAGVHTNSVAALEKEKDLTSRREMPGTRPAIERVQRALEDAGVIIHSAPVGVFLKN